MPRDIPVGNGNFLIVFDQDYCLRDIYYPSIGKENHSEGHKFRFGIWVDGKFDWLNRGWGLNLEYTQESLLTRVTAVNKTFKVRDRKSTRLNSSHIPLSRMPSSA